MSYDSFAMENCYGKFIVLVLYFVLYLNIVVTKFWIPNVYVSMITANLRVQNIFAYLHQNNRNRLMKMKSSDWLLSAWNQYFLLSYSLQPRDIFESHRIYFQIYFHHTEFGKTIRMFTNPRAERKFECF